MTHPPSYPSGEQLAPPPGCPAHAAGQAPPPDPTAFPAPGYVPLFGEDFSADPQPTYRHLRSMGPIAPVEIAPRVYGLITTTYAAALHLLRSTPGQFAKSPRYWRALANGEVPRDSPALMMMMDRNNALWKDGPAHVRLRSAITDGLARIDPHDLRAVAGRSADTLIDAIAPVGSADLVGDYAARLPMEIVLQLFGCPPQLGRRIVSSLAKLFDTAQDAAAANAELERACLELTHLKRTTPESDMTSWLLAHPAELTDAEMIQQILLVIGASTEPCTNLIGNAVKLMLTDDRFAGSVLDGAQSVSRALDYVLWTDPPMANYSPLYAREDLVYQGLFIPAGVPILVSFAAANTDPALRLDGTHLAGNEAHLAFSAGVHRCPAPDIARVIAEVAVERVLDRLPGLDLATPVHQLGRRPGTFHSGWSTLPVTFPSVAMSGDSWTPSPPPPAPTVSTPPARTSTPKPGSSAPRAPRRRWNFPVQWWRGR
ncbi:cytochrome P450 [Sphaerisporangium sp. NPDC049003]|uniref:cytochrome P450 n=1 Tax=Sphaerisporangium sp. NPDC049003 TaxID=3364517 RepID=UPI003711AB8B